MDLSAFEKRANQADETIEQLTKKIEQLEHSILNKERKQINITSSSSSSSNETETVPLSTYESLKKENEKLKQEIEKQNYRITHLLRNMK